MADENIHSDLVEIALENATGSSFEHFVHAFFPALLGVGFVPLGGMHDGGADAFQADESLWADKDPGVFYQASVQVDYRTKIKATIQRLKKVGRKPTSLGYLTSRRIGMVDAEARKLSLEFGVAVQIRDRSYITAHVNDSAQTRDAFRQQLGQHLQHLSRLGSAQTIGPSRHVKSPAVFVFLQQEVERRSGNQSLSEAVVDSLILWSLEGTDPDLKIFRTRAEIATAIQEALPFAGPLVQAHLNNRLAFLSSRENRSGREIRHHEREDLFCLPYETRKKVDAENISDEALRIKVLGIMESRISSVVGGIDPTDVPIAASLAMKTLQLTFEREGLEFAAFLENGQNNAEYPSLADHADIAINEGSVAPSKNELFKEAILSALRETFYKSAPEERMFLSKLAHTYSLLFSLRAEPRIVGYFEEMSSDFNLYVGADLIVRALSERYVRLEDQRVRTLLKMLATAGSKLVLTEPVLEEVHHHLRTTDLEFRNYFAVQEKTVTYQIARNCGKILIRAYFYSKFDPPEKLQVPRSWQAYLQQFCTPSKLGSAEGQEELKRYLVSNFGLTYETRDEIERLLQVGKDQPEIDGIAAALSLAKTATTLAMNDALMVFAVYRRREQSGEAAKQTVFGYRTWWLTGETSIYKHTQHLVNRFGARYMMRPEFLLNFIAMSPKLSQVRAAYKGIFPSLLGIRLANRMKEDVYHDMMAKVKDAACLEPGRVEALVSQYSDELKSNYLKVYEYKL